MADVRLWLPAAGGTATLGRHQKATIQALPASPSIGEFSPRVTLPYVNVDSDLSDLARDWVEQDRAAHLPITRPGKPKLARMSLTVVVADPSDSQKSVEDPLGPLQRLRLIAGGEWPCIVAYGPYSSDARLTRSGWWIIRDMAVHVVARAHVNNAITRAEVTLDFGEANIPGFTYTAQQYSRLKVGEVFIPGAGTGRPGTYTVRGDERLWEIAGALYGDPTRWRALADANQIVDPASQVYPGRILVVP